MGGAGGAGGARLVLVAGLGWSMPDGYPRRPWPPYKLAPDADVGGAGGAGGARLVLVAVLFLDNVLLGAG